jgi:glycosyltransferase involved in cell wall biosynthesis
LAGGGIGQFVSSVAGLLSGVAEVTVFTTSLLRDRYEQLQAKGDDPLPGVRVVFVEEPSVVELGGWYHVMHCYSGRVWEALRGVYGERGPEVIEFADYLGEGFVTLQAAWALDPFLSTSRVCVRVHTSTEMVEVLNGFWKPDLASRVVHAMERFCLGGADRVVWQGGDVWGAYERFYGVGGLGVGVCVRQPCLGFSGVGSGWEPAGDGRVRFLYAGRFERRKGVVNLVRAVTGLERDDFLLTLVGGDTDTGPLGTSVRDLVGLAVGADERVRVLDGVGRGRLGELIASHDVVVVPSLWECWPYAALEGLWCNRPVLGTPVGGLVEMVVSGRSGWLAAGTGVGDLAEAVGGVLDSREQVGELIGAGGPVARARELCDEQRIVDGYEGLARAVISRPVASRRVGVRSGDGWPLVSAVVPYFGAARYVAETVDSLLAQSYRRLEIVLVVDGSFGDEDWVVAQIAGRLPVVVVSQMNQGLGAARNFGISQSRGRYVFPLDADNVAEPEFVARCVEVLEARPRVAYVTSWSRFVDPDGKPLPGPAGYQPLGNQTPLVSEENVAGDAAAVIPRRVFDQGFSYSEELTSYEDWHFYRELHEAQRYGVVIPERLIRYRVRPDSMQAQIAQPHRPRLEGEMNARIRENATQWTSSSA